MSRRPATPHDENSGEAEFRKLGYEQFIAGRRLRSEGLAVGRNSLAGSELSSVAAVAGRSLDDPDLRLSLFAVGDDDQNIYAFAGASIRFIRQFETDYKAKPEFLTENYRSTQHIIDSANAVIAPAASRMKSGHDITVNRKREKDPLGGAMTSLDPVDACAGTR